MAITYTEYEKEQLQRKRVFEQDELAQRFGEAVRSKLNEEYQSSGIVINAYQNNPLVGGRIENYTNNSLGIIQTVPATPNKLLLLIEDEYEA